MADDAGVRAEHVSASGKALFDWEVDDAGNHIADGGLTVWERWRGHDFTATVHLRVEAPPETVAHELAHVVLRHRTGTRYAQHGPKHRALTERILEAITNEPGL